MTKRNGQRAAKHNGERRQSADVEKPQRNESAKRGAKAPKPVAPVVEPQAENAMEAELSRMISELNEVRMRLDAIVRKLASSALDVAGSVESVDDVERLRMRLLGKLDRVREQLVARLSEERAADRDR